MKLLLAALLILSCLAGVAHASPFLVCDAPAGSVDYYVVTGLPDGLGAEKVLPDSTKKSGFRLDLASLPVGDYKVTAKACAGLWGCSADSSPFAFSRPALGLSPANIKLSQ